MYTGAVRVVDRGQDHLIHHLLGSDIGCQIYHLSPKWRTGMQGIIYTITSMTHPCYASVTSAVILPKITVSRCVDIIDVVPPIALITVYCSVSSGVRGGVTG